MPNATFVQTSFLGGEWSNYSQGRMDSERYKTAMHRCLNGYPLEEGSWTRRQGTRYIAHTKFGLHAVLRGFAHSVEEPYQIELGITYARFFLGPSLVYDLPAAESPEKLVMSISTATPARVRTTTNHSLSTDDHVMFFWDLDENTEPNGHFMRNRQFRITVIDGDEFDLRDPITGDAIVGTALGFASTEDKGFVRRISQVVTPYLVDQYQLTRLTQNDETVVLFNPFHPPQTIEVTGNPVTPFLLTEETFIDGPYLDPPNPDTNTTTLDPSGVSGSVTLVASSVTNINGGLGFQASDVGRLIRLLWEPPLWVLGAPYALGALVTYNDQYFVNLDSSMTTSDYTPERDVTNWTFATDAAVWTWGTITARASTTSVTFRIDGDPLPDHTPRLVWRLGAYSDTTGWPKFGSFHDGRLWLMGVINNRIDGSVANSIRGWFDFSPTLPDGTVVDDNAVVAIANSEDNNKAVWLKTDDDGLLVGTKGGEWRGKASANNDPISPTNFDFRRVSKYKCFDAEPAMAPSMTIFIQLTQRKVMEWGYYGAEGYRASHLSIAARHLTVTGVAEVMYQADPIPMLWARREDGVLIGSAYKRDPEAGYHAAWWEALLGWTTDATGRECVSLSTGVFGPSVDSYGDAVSPGGLSEALYMVTKGPDAYYGVDLHFVEVLTPVFEDDQEPWAGWFVDSATTPQAVQVTQDDVEEVPAPPAVFTIYGYWHLRGQTVSVMVNGIDLGDTEVAEDGSAVVTSPHAEVTLAYLIALDDPTAYGDMGFSIAVFTGVEGDYTTYMIPGVVGVTYESRGQLLRPDTGNDAGAANGPAFSKIRRIHKYSAHLHRTLTVEFGVNFEDSLKPAPMKNEDGTDLALGELFSGIVRDSMDAGYDTEGKTAWRINRPYPLVITAVGGALATQDE